MSTKQSGEMLLARILLGLGTLIVFVSGCANPVAHIPVFDKSQAAATQPLQGIFVRDSTYRLVPYDVINIKYTYHPEIDPKVPIIIRPDGDIVLEGIGSIQAVNRTPEELAKLIAEKSSSRLRDPEVIVSVAGYAPRRAFIGGEVKSPGIVNIQEGMTPLQAIFDRGGFTHTAQVDSVILIRDAASGTPKIGRIDLQQAMEGGLPEQFALLPNDVVYVPMTGIGRADLWVKQHIEDLIPQAFLRPPIPTAGMLFR